MSANPGFLWVFISVLNLTGAQIGYIVAYQNQLSACFKAKFGWQDGYDTDIHNSLLGCSVVVGLALGAICGGRLIQIGRRRSIFVICTIGIIGNLITINIDSFVCMCIGRVLYGFSGGLFSSIVPKYMEETIPLHHFETVVASYHASQSIGNLLGTFEDKIMPDDKDTAALIADTNWRIIYIYFPVALQIVILLAMVFVVRYESIKFIIL